MSLKKSSQDKRKPRFKKSLKSCNEADKKGKKKKKKPCLLPALVLMAGTAWLKVFRPL